MTRFRLLMLIALLGLAGYGVVRWYNYCAILASRRADAAARDAVDSALAERISTETFAGPARPWGEVFDALTARCDVPLKLDESEMQSHGIDRLTLVDVPQGEFTLAELLTNITDSQSVAWHRSGDAILITSQIKAQPANDKLYTRTYILPAGSASGQELTDDAEELCELISTVIEPDSWDEFGGPGVIRAAGGALVVHQTREIHQIIDSVLSRMAEHPGGSPRQFALHEPYPTPAEEAIFAALSQKDSIDFVDEPLDRAMASLGKRHGISIRLNAQLLSEAAISLDTPLNKHLKNVSLRTILRELAGDLGLTYIVRNGAIVVTTPEDAESDLFHWFYEVRDLVEDDPAQMEELIDLITREIEPHSWDEVGGPGCITPLGEGWLIVSQTQEIQERVLQLLSRTRSLLAPDRGVGDVILDSADDVAPAIRAALNREVSFSFKDTPLKDVADYVSDLLQIPVLLRQKELEEAAANPDMPLTAELPPLPLKQALPLALDELGLRCHPKGEVLYITTPEDAENDLETRAIDVRHLDGDSLRDLIQDGIEPDSWDEVGGPGTIEVFRGLLVVTQTHEIGEKVQALIDALNEHWLPSAAGRGIASSTEPIWVGLSKSEEEIIRRLERRDSLHGMNRHLGDTMQALCSRHAIPVVFDRLWDESGPDPFGSVIPEATLHFDEVPLYEILTNLVEQGGGYIAVRRGVLIINCDNRIEGDLFTRLYPLGTRSTDQVPLRAHEVRRLILDRIEPDSWDESGGGGILQTVGDQWLLVTQTLDVHRRVEGALAKLRAGEELSPRPILFIGGPPEFRPPSHPVLESIWRASRRLFEWGLHD